MEETAITSASFIEAGRIRSHLFENFPRSRWLASVLIDRINDARSRFVKSSTPVPDLLFGAIEIGSPDGFISVFTHYWLAKWIGASANTFGNAGEILDERVGYFRNTLPRKSLRKHLDVGWNGFSGFIKNDRNSFSSSLFTLLTTWGTRNSNSNRIPRKN